MICGIGRKTFEYQWYMRLSPYLRPDLVLLEFRAEGLEDAIHTLVAFAGEVGVVSDTAALENALIGRESAHSTIMGDGVAVPNATVPGLERPVLILAVAPEGAEFGPYGSDPVHLFLVLLSPKDQAGLHIKLLARITRLISHPGLIARLLAARSSAELVEELEIVDAQHV